MPEVNVKSAAEELAALELEIKREELEQLKLTREERRLSITDLRAKLADREVKDIQIANDRQTRGQAFNRDRAANESRWKACTHKKGGKVSERDMNALYVGGNAEQYAILRHQMSNGDVWVRCLRCGKAWVPPVKLKFYFDEKGRETTVALGVFDQERFNKAVQDYQQALQFPTNNTMSTSHIFQFQRINEKGERVDAKQETRDFLKDVNLT